MGMDICWHRAPGFDEIAKELGFDSRLSGRYEFTDCFEDDECEVVTHGTSDYGWYDDRPRYWRHKAEHYQAIRERVSKLPVNSEAFLEQLDKLESDKTLYLYISH